MRIHLIEGFREILCGISSRDEVGKIDSYNEAVIEMQSGGLKGVPTEFLADIYVNIDNELKARGVNIRVGIELSPFNL